MTRADGYSGSSIVVHWLAAILVIALFITHEGDRGSAGYVFHVSGGAIAGVFLLWRVWHRVRRGSTHPPKQAAVFNLAARLVHWGLLVAIVVVRGFRLPAAVVARARAGRVRFRHSVSDGSEPGRARVRGTGARRLGPSLHSAPRPACPGGRQARRFRLAPRGASHVQAHRWGSMTTASGLDSLFRARFSRERRIRTGASSDVKDREPVARTAPRGTLVGADTGGAPGVRIRANGPRNLRA